MNTEFSHSMEGKSPFPPSMETILWMQGNVFDEFTPIKGTITRDFLY